MAGGMDEQRVRWQSGTEDWTGVLHPDLVGRQIWCRKACDVPVFGAKHMTAHGLFHAQEDLWF